MSFDYSKRLSQLQQKVNQTNEGYISFARAFFLSLLATGTVFFVLHLIFDSETPPQSNPYGQRTLSERLNLDTQSVGRSWQTKAVSDVKERYHWLKGSFFGESSAMQYRSFAEYIITEFASDDSSESFLSSVKYFFANSLLRIGFLFVGWFPAWIIAGVIGYLGVTYFVRPTRGKDLLGVADPGKTPFYSGAWGVLIPNNSISATDYAVPGLACPKMQPKNVAQRHRIVQYLTKAGAMNNTNLGLARVILAYADYPSYVPEERSSDEINENTEDQPTYKASLASTDCLTIEKSTPIGLQAITEAHEIANIYRNEVDKHGATIDAREHFEQFRALIEQLSAKVSPLAATLAKSLTPRRAYAISKLPISAICTAYLSTEAGKSLVFQRLHGQGFSQMSLFPHLQARAVMQSMPEFVEEYDGDMRLFIRHAVCFSRRHGDFGRTFLPMNMSVASRGLRDWLEILYCSEQIREVHAELVELDGHLDEVHANFQNQLKKAVHERVKDADGTSGGALWRGVPYKSVVLMPLRSVVRIALEGYSEYRQKHILKLIDDTRPRQRALSTSAALPGFRRLVESDDNLYPWAGGVTEQLASRKSDKGLATQWLMIRRMLTVYNWLSTRVGDDSVPPDGLVQAAVITRQLSGESDVTGLEALVPLRARRFKPLLGDSWQLEHYADTPEERDVKVITDHTEFENKVKKLTQEIRPGG